LHDTRLKNLDIAIIYEFSRRWAYNKSADPQVLLAPELYGGLWRNGFSIHARPVSGRSPEAILDSVKINYQNPILSRCTDLADLKAMKLQLHPLGG